jgi:arabinofuranosyltransferase
VVASDERVTVEPRRVQGSRGKRPIAAGGWEAAVVILPAAAIIVLGYFRRHLSDDGLIYSRAVRQILAGNGPVFNIGERAESSTSALWQWLLALASWTTRMDVGQVAVFGSLLLTGLGFAVALDGTRRFHRPPDSSTSERGVDGNRSGRFILLPAGIVLLLAMPPAWDYATSGLESGLQSFWLATCWWLLVHSRSPLRPRALTVISAVIGLGPLVRPELGIVTIAFLAAVLLNARPSRKGILLNVFAAGALPFGYEIFRAGYYGLLVPLPALAKEASSMNWSRGIAYLKDFIEPYWLSAPLVAVGFLVATVTLAQKEVSRRMRTKNLTITAAPVFSGLILTAYVIAVGGDFMHARMLLPPLFLLLLPVLLVPATRVTVALVAVTAAWAIVAMSPMRSPFDGGGATPGIVTQKIRLFTELKTQRINPTRAEDWLPGFAWLPNAVNRAASTHEAALVYGLNNSVIAPARTDAGARVVMAGGFLGITGAMAPLEFRIADHFGLAYPLDAHFKLVERGAMPGHEKPLPLVWFFADYADPATPLPPGSAADGVTHAAIVAARHALQCGELRELHEAVRESMSWSRFLQNLIGSVRRTQLRVPPDPFEAKEQFCGARGEPQTFGG